MKIKKNMPLILALMVIFLLPGCMKEQSDNFKSNLSYFGPVYFSTLHNTSEDDTEIAEEIINTANEVLCYLGDESGVKNDIGEMKVYYPFWVASEDGGQYVVKQEIARAEGQFELMSANIHSKSGTMWVSYWRNQYTADSELCRGAGSEEFPVICRWRIEKVDGKWTVTDIKERP